MQRYRAEPFMQPIAPRSPGEAGAHPAVGEAPTLGTALGTALGLALGAGEPVPV